MATAKKIVYNDNSPIIVDYATNDSKGNNIANYYLPVSSFSWANLSDKPTALSQFTNDSGFITQSSVTWANLPDKPAIPTVPTNISAFTNDSGYITTSALSGYATQTWVKQNPKYTISLSGSTLTIKTNY